MSGEWQQSPGQLDERSSKRYVQAMRWLAIVVLGLGCAKPPPPSLVEPSNGVPFLDEGNYKPKSFGVKVAGSGRPIIFIPGLACPGEMWDDTVEHLGDGYQTHVLTLSGFAGRPRVSGPLSATVRKELVRYIRSRRLKDPIIVGHSLGGFIAYWLAATAPELVGGLVVVDAGPALSDTDEDTAKELRSLWTAADDDDFENQIKNVFDGMISDPKKLAPYMAAVAKSDRYAVGNAIYEVVTTDLRDDVSKIHAPVLVVLADGGLQNMLKSQVEPIANHEVKVIPHAHHFVMLDDPKAWFKVLDAFLDAH
jgi:pimeloyl-ACP methyl ester carboxylesterase